MIIHPGFALMLVAVLLVGCGEAEVAGQAREARATPIAAVEVVPRDLSRRLSLSAPVQSRSHIRLASRSSGTLARVLVEEGDRVRAGQLLAELDTAEQRAELARAEAERERAELDYQRTRELRERGVASPAEYQQARATLAVARSERELWATRLAFGRITSPRDAIITARHVEPGEGIQPQDVLFELAVMDELVIRPGVSELDVVHLEVGQSLTVTLDAMPTQPFAGSIRRIFPAADGTSRLVTVEIALPVEAHEQGVRPGFLARVQLQVDQRDDSLALPVSAIGENGDDRYVYVISDEQLARRVIKPGVTRGQWTEVLDGLERGEIVLATNPIDMRDGERVRIVGWRG